MRANELSPDSLVATTESIRGSLYRPEQREPLIAAGFDWSSFEHAFTDLQAAGVGFARGCYPIRIQIGDAGKRDKIAPVLERLRSDLDRLRELGPRVFSTPEQIHVRIQCTVPDGTPHSELRGLDPATTFVIALQDSNEFVRDELPHLARLTSAWAIYLFGNYLDDHDFANVDFRRFRDLRELDLAENNLTRLPAGIIDCNKLERLSLARNPNLRSVPVELVRLRSLRILDLSGTNLSAQTIRQLNAGLTSCQVRV